MWSCFSCDIILLFGTVDENTLLDGLELLASLVDGLAGTLGRGTENELGSEVPLERNVPFEPGQYTVTWIASPERVKHTTRSWPFGQ